MSNKGLVYEGKKARACLPNGETKEYTPCVFRGDSCFLAISAFGNDKETKVAVVSSRLILAYRVTEVLSALEIIGAEIMPYLACLIAGNVFQQFKGREVDEEKYRKIMAMPIPPEIIAAIVKEGNLLEVEELDFEVSCGNIPWRPEFEKLGIEDPVKVAERLKEEKLLILERLKKPFEEYQAALHLKDPALINSINEKMVEIARAAKLPDEVIIVAAGVDRFFAYSIEGEIFPLGIATLFSQMEQIQFLQESADWLQEKTGESERECVATIMEAICKYT